MKNGLKSVVGFFLVLPFVIGSCMMNDTEDFPDFNEQMAKDIAAIDSYLASKGIVAIQDNSGIRYVMHYDSVGTKKPTIDSCVTANYVGKLLSTEQEFDDGEGVSFPLSGVIDGWKLGIPLLSLGDSATLYIPSGLGYGFYGYPPEIPGNAILIFHVGITKVGSTYKTSDRTCN
jgi:FKBP-type peptidyl-prolyl cis-trans isomerase